MILQHGWQPKRTFRHAGNAQVVPKWYSLSDHLRKVLSISTRRFGLALRLFIGKPFPFEVSPRKPCCALN